MARFDSFARVCPTPASQEAQSEAAVTLTTNEVVVEIDDDVRAEYWTEIRKQPDRANDRVA